MIANKSIERCEVLPRMVDIVRIVISGEQNVPSCCQACRFSDQNYSNEWFCVNNRRIDFPRAKPDWCPIVAVNEFETNPQGKYERMEKNDDKNKN